MPKNKQQEAQEKRLQKNIRQAKKTGADVQVAVRLGRETGVDGLTGEAAAGRKILFDKGFDKVFGIFHSVMSTPHKFAMGRKL